MKAPRYITPFAINRFNHTKKVDLELLLMKNEFIIKIAPFR